MEPQVISAIITVSGALIGAFGGAHLANHFAERRFEKQTIADVEKEKKKLLGEKVEELHVLISKWSKYIANINIARLSYLAGKITNDSYKDLVGKMDVESGVHDRIEALIYIYFPEFDNHLKQVRELLSTCNDAEFKFNRRELDRNAAFGLVNNCAEELDKLFINMNKKLVEVIK